MKKPRSKKESTIDVIVKYPDHQVTFAVPSTTTGKELLIKTCARIQLFEYWWMGLSGYDVHMNPIWLNDNKKITSQHLYTKNKEAYTLKFEVKYYPIDIKSETIQTKTWKCMYRDLREQIMAEKLYCDPTTIVSLSALHLQYTVGYKGKKEPIKSIVSKYLNQLVPPGVKERYSIGDDEWETIISDMWKSFKNMTSSEALLEALRLMQDLDMYGVRYFNIKNKKGSDLLLGIDCDGINIYKVTNKLVPEVGLSWCEIKSVQYVNSKFVIKPLDKNASEFHMYSENLERNQLVMHIIIGNHEMYIARRSRTTPDEILEYKKKATSAQLVEQQKMAEEVLARKRAIELEAKLDAIEEQAVTGGDSSELIDQLKKTYEDELLEMNERMNKLQLEAQNERERNNLTEEEINKIRQMQFETEKKIEEERKHKQELMLKESQALSLAAEKAAEADRAKEELELLKKKYEEDQKLISELISKSVSGEEIVKREKEQDVTAEEAIKATEAALSNKNNARNECDEKYEAIKKSGKTKHQTLKIIRSGNTTARVDIFEAL